MHDLQTIVSMNNKAVKERKPDIVSSLIAYEEGTLGEDETVAMFQALINNGNAWKLQGHYGRTAEEFINAGLFHP